MDEPAAGLEADPPRGAGIDLEDRLHRLADGDRCGRIGNRVLGDADDPAGAVGEDHVERNLGILHPHGDLPRLAEIEQHAVIARHAVAEHQPFGARFGSIGNFSLKRSSSFRRLDNDRLEREMRGPVGSCKARREQGCQSKREKDGLDQLV